MARQDLVELRDSIRGTGFVTASESRALDFYGESRLLELIEVFSAVLDAEDEYYTESDEGEMLEARTVGGEHYDDYDDVGDYWDYYGVEITCEYDEQ